MERFLGKWEVTSTENMDNMLQAVDMEEDKRKMYCDMRFTMEYKKDGDDWSYTVYMPNGMDKTFSYKLGEEFDSTTLDGRPIISCIRVKDNKFVELHKDKNDPSMDGEMIREVTDDDELIVTVNCPICRQILTVLAKHKLPSHKHIVRKRATVRNVTSITRHKRVA